MKRAAAALSISLVAGIAGYLAWAYPKLPATVPLRYSMSSLPLAFGPRELFVGVPAAVTALFFALFLAAARSRPRAAWLATVALALVLFFVHVRVQAVLAAVPPVSETLAVAVVVAAVLGSLAAALFYPKPKPRRVQPF